MIQGTKIVSSEEMQRIEQLCFSKGKSAEELMNRAAEAIASVVEQWFELSNTPREVVLLVGKGNNGADALTVGTLLLKQKFLVSAALVYPPSELSSLCHARFEQFKKAGGRIHQGKETSYSLIIDGIVGTGFHGAADRSMQTIIEWANSQDVAILAIDLPSGLDGTTGVVQAGAINATITCALGLPKMGCFIGQGWDYTGTFLVCDIGLSPDIASQAEATALLLKEESLALPPLVRTRHKYEAGYVLAISGSEEMPGAAALSSLAALRSGAGVVRLFTNAGEPLPPEVIREAIDLSRIKEEMQRASAVLLGPGLGRSPSTQTMIRQLLPILSRPTVVDGDGLYHLAALSTFSLPAGSVLTPHHGEMSRLLGGLPTLDSCQRFAEEHHIPVILKGAPTILFYPHRLPLVIAVGDPGMATAGSGDVLTGMVAAFLAQNKAVDAAAALAVYLHGRAGEIAAERMSSYCMIASDIIDRLPDAFQELM